MNHFHFRRATLAVLCVLGFSCAARAQNQTVNGNLTVTGTIGSAGAIDSDSNVFSFGTQGAGYGGALIYQDANADTFTFSANRSPASWLWQHLTGVAAMRLDANHQLILYQNNGTTAGITLTPASNSLKLGSHANGTLTADANGVITAGGGFTVAGNFTNSNGSFTGGSSGLTLSAGGANQAVTLNSSGTGDLIFKTNGTERARINSAGNLGIGTASPQRALEIGTNDVGGMGFERFVSSPNSGALRFGDGSGWKFHIGRSRNFSGGPLNSGANGVLATFQDDGRVGIGTTSPAYELDVAGVIGLFSGNPVLLTRDSDSVASSAGVTGYVSFRDSSGSEYGWVGDGSPSDNYISVFGEANHGVRFGAGGTSRMWISTAGNVGIGTAAPSTKLEVKGMNVSGKGLLYINGDDHGFIVANAPTTGVVGIAFSKDGGTNWSAGMAANDASYYIAEGASVGTSQRFSIAPGGNVGIGTVNPAAKLQVGGYNLIKDGTWAPPLAPGTTSSGERIVFYENPNWKTAIGMDGQNGIWFQVHTPANQVAYQWFTGAITSAPTEKMRMMDNGNVGIGTTSPTHKLAVNGTIRAKEVIVDTGWADYVFDESYRLAPLSEVEAHIHEKKHLPGIPSAAEVAAHGVSMGEMQSKLLSKIEEITLRQIAQEKDLSALKTQNAELRRQLTALQPVGR